MGDGAATGPLGEVPHTCHEGAPEADDPLGYKVAAGVLHHIEFNLFSVLQRLGVALREGGGVAVHFPQLPVVRLEETVAPVLHPAAADSSHAGERGLPHEQRRGRQSCLVMPGATCVRCHEIFVPRRHFIFEHLVKIEDPRGPRLPRRAAATQEAREVRDHLLPIPAEQGTKLLQRRPFHILADEAAEHLKALAVESLALAPLHTGLAAIIHRRLRSLGAVGTVDPETNAARCATPADVRDIARGLLGLHQFIS
jgi:hypothetical protein